jgi:G:T-mismatch repair DNA endonuclease (very short patch repair protein)
MADTLSKKQRSAVMAKVRSHGNKATEIALLKLMRRMFQVSFYDDGVDVGDKTCPLSDKKSCIDNENHFLNLLKQDQSDEVK